MSDVTADFTQTCNECDPPRTVAYRDGRRVPGPCPHELPAVEVTGEQPWEAGRA